MVTSVFQVHTCPSSMSRSSYALRSRRCLIRYLVQDSPTSAATPLQPRCNSAFLFGCAVLPSSSNPPPPLPSPCLQPPSSYLIRVTECSFGAHMALLTRYLALVPLLFRHGGERIFDQIARQLALLGVCISASCCSRTVRDAGSFEQVSFVTTASGCMSVKCKVSPH